MHWTPFPFYRYQPRSQCRIVWWLKHITGLGYGYRLKTGFLFCAEIGIRDLWPCLCNVSMFCIVQCSHRVWNPSPEMCLSLEWTGLLVQQQPRRLHLLCTSLNKDICSVTLHNDTTTLSSLRDNLLSLLFSLVHLMHCCPLQTGRRSWRRCREASITSVTSFPRRNSRSSWKPSPWVRSANHLSLFLILLLSFFLGVGGKVDWNVFNQKDGIIQATASWRNSSQFLSSFKEIFTLERNKARKRSYFILRKSLELTPLNWIKQRNIWNKMFSYVLCQIPNTRIKIILPP